MSLKKFVLILIFSAAYLGSAFAEYKSGSPEEEGGGIFRGIPIISQVASSVSPEKKDTPPSKTFNVFTEDKDKDNHFFPTGFMGDMFDIKFNPKSTTNPHSGTTCLEFKYTAKMSHGAGWASVYWLNPVNNWGGIEGRYDLTGAKKLTFWARGEKGDEWIDSFKVGGIGNKFPDSDQVYIGPIMLSKDWKKYQIDLRKANLSAISGGFYWSIGRQSNQDGAVFYLDDIVYEY